MRKRHSPSLQLSLLSCAIAAATAGMASGAHAVDLCSGQTSVTISTNVGSDVCYLDIPGVQLTITDTGAIANTINVMTTTAVVSNAGTITENLSANGWTNAYGINAVTDLVAGASISNSGSVTTSATSLSYQAQANGITLGPLSGGAMVTNTGTVTATADAPQAALAYGMGSLSGGNFDNGHLANGAGGVITVSASDHGGYWSALAFGLYHNGSLSNGSSISNDGTVSASASSEGFDEAYAYGLYQSGDKTDSSISNTSTISATASAESAYAAAYGAYLAYSAYGSAVISNSGEIDASASAAGPYASAYGLVAGSLFDTASLTNSGDISADVENTAGYGYVYGVSFGSLNDSATFTNTDTGTISATFTADTWAWAWGISTGALANDAVLSNAGTITATAISSHGAASANGIASTSLYGNASLVNSGSVTATSTSSTSNSYGHGIYTLDLNDAASISNTATGILSETVTSGYWASAYGIYASGNMHTDSAISNAGTITVTASSPIGGGSAYGIATQSMYDNASVTNSGDITATASAVGANGNARGINASGMNGGSAISNAGTVTATATSLSNSASAWGIRTSTFYGGSITNSGTVTATASATTAGRWASASALGSDSWVTMDGVTITNEAGATLTASVTADGGSAYGIHAVGYPGNGSVISNAGTITANVTGGNASSASAYGIYTSSLTDSSIGNTGSVTVSVTAGDEWAGAWGIIAGHLNGTSSISNGDTGLLDVSIDTNSYGTAYGIETNSLYGASTISNSGTITLNASANTWAAAYGIDVDSINSTASITNTGTISVTAHSLNSEDSAWGIHTGAMSGGSVSNSGQIVATAGTDAAGMWASAVGIGSHWGWTSLDGATLENAAAGTITVSAAADSVSAHGILAWGSVTNGSSISNAGTLNASVTADSHWGGAYGMYVGNVDGSSSVSNSGTITATTTVTGSATGSAYGIYVNDLAAGGIVTNSGTITVAGSDTVATFGIVVGGGAGDVINTASGNIGGGVRLGGTVFLTNAGNLTLAAGQASSVGGNYTQSATGQLTTVVKDAGTYGQIGVTGTADFSAGGKLVVELDPTVALADGDMLNNVISAGTLALPTAGLDIVDPSQFWAFTNVGDASSVDLAVSQVDAATVFGSAGVAFTPSQLDLVNNLINGSIGAPYTGLATLLNAAPSASAAAAIVQQLNPTLTGSAGRAALSASSGIGALIDARQAETGAASGDAFTQNGVWLKTFLGKATQDAVNGVHGFDADTTGFVLGLDGNVSDAWRLGVAVAQASTDADDVNSSLDLDTLQFTVYGSYAVSDSTALDLDVDHAVNGVDSTRHVSFAGSTAIASYDGKQTSLGLGLTHRAQVCSGFTVLPGVSLRYRQVHLDGYTETGAGVYDLTVQSRSDSSLLWQARLGMEVGLGGYGTLLGNLGAGYDTLDAASATATLNAGTGPTFISQGAKPESTVLNAGIGYRYVTAKGFEINALYELEDRDTFSADTASLKFRMPF